MKMNLKVRFKNPVFIAQLVMAVLLPILTYMGLTVEDVTTWAILGDALVKAASNPYVLLLVATSVYNAFTDPTTKGIRDSERALKYTKPE